MSRKHTLTQEYQRVLNRVRVGNSTAQKRRLYIMKLIVEDLCQLPQWPQSLANVNRSDIEALVRLWKKQGKSYSTMLNKLAVLRFLAKELPMKDPIPCNTELGLSKRYTTALTDGIDLFQCYRGFRFLLPKMLFGMSLFFGLTVNETLRCTPFSHLAPEGITITPNIAFNGQERYIPACHPEQKALMTQLRGLLKPHESLAEHSERRTLLGLYRGELSAQGLPYAQYRHHYACFREAQLNTHYGKRELCYKIKIEMGLTSSVQLWRYLQTKVLSPSLLSSSLSYEQE